MAQRSNEDEIVTTVELAPGKRGYVRPAKEMLTGAQRAGRRPRLRRPDISLVTGH